jgi:alkylation response protein AidB-like acyl-CoA dehydrogenase
MDLSYGKEYEEFRAEVRAFLRDNVSDEMRQAARFTMWALSEFEYGRRWQKILHARGWGAVGWPVAYGGAGWTRTQRAIWNIECLRAGAPSIMNMGRDLCAPCIMEFGSQEQKDFFLPRILSGEDWWAQGFSESGAGSDLRALRMQALSDAQGFVLNGSKIWTSFAQFANRIFLLVRSGSGPKPHDGISFLLVDMDTPGISVRPIATLSGDPEFCEVFFDAVRVPKSRLLGSENEGWRVVRHLLMYEHGGGDDRSAQLDSRLAWLREIAALELDGEDRPLLENPDFARRLAELEIEVTAVAFAADELSRLARAGAPPSAATELLAIRSRVVGQRIAELAMRAVGRWGIPLQREARVVGSGVAPVGPEHALTPMPFYLGQRAATIAGGTDEIHHNNVARHVLGL